MILISEGMCDEMILSIIVPVYNCEKTIKSTIISIIDQLTENTELIIVDDGSTDKSNNIIKDTICGNVKVKLLTKENQGPVLARYEGLKEASGDYIWFVDGGDTIESNAINKIISELKDIDIILFNYTEFNSENVFLHKQKVSDNMLISDFLTGKIFPSVWSKIFRRTLILDCNCWNLKDLFLGEDMVLTLDAICNSNHYKYIDESLYNYIRDSNSITMSGKNTISILSSLEELKLCLININLYSSYKKEFEYLVFCQLIINCILLSYKNKYFREIYNAYKTYNIKLLKNKYLKNKIILLLVAKFRLYLPFKKPMNKFINFLRRFK